MNIRLADIVHARSGDKADWVDFGLFAWNAAGHAVIEREVTAERVQSHFAPKLSGPVECWSLPNILAPKLLLREALQGGGARHLRIDNPGKAMAGSLLRDDHAERQRMGTMPGRAACRMVAGHERE